MDNSPGYNLCVLCCCSFGGGSPSTTTICRQDLLNFFKILVESPPQFEGDVNLSVTDFQRILDSSGLSVCGDCHTFVTVALETRSRAVQMEMNVRKLQMQILEQLRALNSELDLFHEEMTKIESVVKTSDESCLIFHMPRRNTSQGVMERGSGGGGGGGGEVMVLRERILDVVTDLRIYQVSCSADARLPVDENEVEAMWEDAQQLVQCTPEISMEEYQGKREYQVDDFTNDSSGGPCSSLGESESQFVTTTTPVMYMGHSVGTMEFHSEEGDDDNDNDNDNDNDSEMEEDEAGTPGSQELNMTIISQQESPSKPRGGFFKEDVIHRALAREDTRTPDMSISTDPLRKFYLRYDPKKSKLFVGEVEVVINEVDETLQCSQCSIMGKRSKSNHQSKQSWRDMEKGILVHVIGKHLGGFQCQLCQEVFTSHTMIKKHNSKEHNGQMAVALPQLQPQPSPSPVSSPVTPGGGSVKPLKPYPCSSCTSAFKKPSELKRHFLAKHSKFINQNQPETSPAPPPPSVQVQVVMGEATMPVLNVAKRTGGKRRRPVSVTTVGVVTGVSPLSLQGSPGSGGEKVIPTKSAKRPHECHICKYAFTKGSHLKRHLEVHRKRNELF